jgi:hypothetical protein
MNLKSYHKKLAKLVQAKKVSQTKCLASKRKRLRYESLLLVFASKVLSNERQLHSMETAFIFGRKKV